MSATRTNPARKGKHSSTAATEPPTPTHAVFISRADAAVLCCLNIQTIDEAIKNAKLRRFKVGRRVLLKRADVVAWIEGQEA